MANVAQLISAIAQLLWPLVAFAAILMFRPQLTDLLQRLRKGKLFGQEIELGDSLAKLEESANAAQSEVARLPPSSEQGTADNGSREQTDAASAIDRVITTAAQSPTAALVLLAAELEREVRQLLASLGLLRGRRSVPIRQAIAELDEYGLPRHVPSSLRLFWEVRHRLVHGHSASDSDTLSAIDSGIAIMRALKAVPHEIYTVYRSGVTIFSDPECTHAIPNAKGVILETTSPGGTSKSHRIFPTTRMDFISGTRVSWEWSASKKFTDAWYRDPDTNAISLAWNSSMEFVGRNLDDV